MDGTPRFLPPQPPHCRRHAVLCIVGYLIVSIVTYRPGLLRLRDLPAAPQTLMHGQVDIMYARWASAVAAVMALLFFNGPEQFMTCWAFGPRLTDGPALKTAVFSTDGFGHVQFQATGSINAHCVSRYHLRPSFLCTSPWELESHNCLDGSELCQGSIILGQLHFDDVQVRTKAKAGRRLTNFYSACMYNDN